MPQEPKLRQIKFRIPNHYKPAVSDEGGINGVEIEFEILAQPIETDGIYDRMKETLLGPLNRSQIDELYDGMLEEIDHITLGHMLSEFVVREK